MLSKYDLADIKPGESDTRIVDFAVRADGSGIVSATWSCGVSSMSTMQDADPASRLKGASNNYGTVSEQMFGDMINGVIYDISITAVLTNSKVLIESRNITCTATGIPVPLDSSGSDILTVDRFRTDLPAFNSPLIYTDESIQYWINIGVLLLNATRFQDMYLYAQEMFVAHELTLERYNESLAARNGGLVPIGVGPAASRSVGGVSVSYDYNLSSYPDAGLLNLTIYGQRLYRLIMMFGAGPLQF